MNLRKPAVLLFSLFFILASAHTLFAQSGAGSIQGTVTDATGAVIPGAAVQVVNVATGVVTNTKSDKVGFYQVPELFTGSYRISVTAPGMKTYETRIDLLVAQAAVINPALTAGDVTQQVVVSGNLVQLTTTDNGTINSTLERSRIEQLPENGRFLNSLAQMATPGLEDGGLRSNGLLLDSFEYRIDGTETTNVHQGGGSDNQIQLLDPDSVQEVQINTTNSGAEYPTAATGIVTTKSGTNVLHGTAFETARNNALGIAKSRANPFNLVAPQYDRNEFGASAGGPIILPHVYHGKNKSFWFFAYERYSLAQLNSLAFTVPTLAMRQGNFNGVVNAAGNLQVIYDPSTTKANAACPVPTPGPTYSSTTTSNNAYCRTPFANNTIPAGAESPTAAILFATMPLPTSTNNPLVQTNLTIGAKTFQYIPQETFRLDHAFNDNNRAYMRFTNESQPANRSNAGTGNVSAPLSVAAGNLPAGATEGYSNNVLQDDMAGIGYTHVFSPTFYSETVVNEQWLANDGVNGTDANVDLEAPLGIPNNFGEPGFPNVSGLIDPLITSQNAILYSQIVLNVDENLTKNVGRQQLHFGGHWQHYRDAEHPAGLPDAIAFDASPAGLYNSSTGANYTDTANAGLADASLFLGSPASFTVYLPVPHAHYHWNDVAAYIQDDYHWSKNLTFNIGLRYEAHPGAWVKYGLNSAIDFKTGAIVTAVTPATLISEGYTTQSVISSMENIGVVFETPQEAGMPASLARNYDFNFLPRFGFAYRLFDGKPGTVVRGAFGRFTQRSDTENSLDHDVKQDPIVDDWVQSYTTAAQAVDGLPNEEIRYNDPVKFGQLGSTTNGLANAVNTGANSITPGIATWADDPNWAPAYVSQTNFTIEQPFKGNSVLRASWVWVHTSNLDIGHGFNTALSTYQWEMAKGIVPPTGGASVIGTTQQNTYSTTALGPYNQTIYSTAVPNGGSSFHTKTGWMNDNELQVNYQRLFHHGFAYQIYYVFSKDLRAGGDALGNIDTINSNTYPYADFPGGEGTVATMTSPYGTIGPARVAPVPPANVQDWQGYHALNHFSLYGLDNAVPIHHIQFNGILELPIGSGKWLLGNANRFVNELIGGYQISGQGSVVSQVFRAPTAHWGAVSPNQIYKHKYPIVDCSSGNCYKEFLWNNGYISPKFLPSPLGNCTSNCISGVPASYVPNQAPIDNTPGTTYFGTDEVQISAPGLGASPQNIAYDAGPIDAHIGGVSFLNGPINWEADASIFKVFPIKESVNLRINMDVFNAFNHQGFNSPNTTSGIEAVQPGGASGASSYNTPRQIQITARLSF